jgi:hypothetical protein
MAKDVYLQQQSLGGLLWSGSMKTFYLPCMTAVSLFLLTQFAAGANSCISELPPEAHTLLTTHFKNWKVVTVDDLRPEDQILWHKKFDNRCPGVTSGHFGPASETSYAVTLIRRREKRLYQTLLLLQRTDKRYSTVTLSPAQPVYFASVINSLPAAEYSSWDHSKRVQTKFDLILYEAIEAGALAYYWDSNQFKKLQISD